MNGRVIHWLLSFLLCSFVYFGRMTERAAGVAQKQQMANDQDKMSSSSTCLLIPQRDITTPITTLPTKNHTSCAPILNPNSVPLTPATEVPFPVTTPDSGSSGAGSWCIASHTASHPALQAALDYACGYGKADCSAIQPGGSCYYPNSVQAHASYAFNNYYHKNPVPNSCNFGGTALITSTDPSSLACHYPSTSTSSSVLDTANQNRSTVFGVAPTGPSSFAATLVAGGIVSHALSQMYIFYCGIQN